MSSLDTSRPQNFQNHRAMPPAIYMAAGLVFVVEAGHRIWLAIDTPGWWSALGGASGLALLILWWAARRDAQVVQDRVIRLEMHLRLERLLGAGRRADITRIGRKQIIALRFASDAELPPLVEDVLAGRMSDPDAIKKRVNAWQADWLRV